MTTADLADLSDDSLVQRMAAGDHHALGALYDRHGGLAFGIAHKMLGDRETAADAVQEAFLSVWRHATLFVPDRGSARAWILASVRHRCIDILRGPRRQHEVDAAEAIIDGIAAPDDVWESVWREIAAQDVQQALASLPEEQRTTVHLAFFGGLTHAQIAAHMQVPLGTVKGRLRLGMEKMRALLTRGGVGSAT